MPAATAIASRCLSAGGTNVVPRVNVSFGTAVSLNSAAASPPVVG